MHFSGWPVTSMGCRTVGTNRMGPGVRSLSRFAEAEARFKGLNLAFFLKRGAGSIVTWRSWRYILSICFHDYDVIGRVTRLNALLASVCQTVILRHPSTNPQTSEACGCNFKTLSLELAYRRRRAICSFAALSCTCFIFALGCQVQKWWAKPPIYHELPVINI